MSRLEGPPQKGHGGGIAWDEEMADTDFEDDTDQDVEEISLAY